MLNRRQLLKTCTSLADTIHAMPALVVDKYYQMAVEKIWRPNSTHLSNITERRKEWVRMATLAASSHNSQPWKFKLKSNLITNIPDFQHRCPAVDPDNSHLFKSLGCAAENIIQAAKADGFHADAQFDPKQDTVTINFESTATTKLDNLSAALINRCCSHIPYDGNPVAATVQTSLITAATSTDLTPLILQSPNQIEGMLEYVRQGNLAQFDDTAFVKELRDWIRFNPTDAIATGYGLAGEVSGQPSIPAWVGRNTFNLFLTGNKQADIDAKASRGSEVRSLRPQLHAWLGVPQRHVHLIVRYGGGRITPHSLLRPVEEVIIT